MTRDINEIISKVITGKYIDEEERQYFELWLNEAGNECFYKKLETYCRENKFVVQENHMDVDCAYQKHLKKLREVKAKKRRMLFSRMMPYAAMLVVMIGVFVLLTYFGRDNGGVSRDNQWLLSMEPGTNKAELILADGKVLNLMTESKKNQIKEKDGTLINNTGSSLIYDVTDQSEQEELTYNNLVVPRGGEFKLELEDGTKVWVNSETRLRYPTKFPNAERVVLLEGEAYFEVSKDRDRPFIVKTQGVDVRVLGTSFNISSYSDEEEIRTTLVEGSVEVSDSEKQVRKVVLKPGYQAVYLKDQRELSAAKVNIELYTSWKDGRFVFDRTELDDILNRVSRWYDVKVFYQNSGIGIVRFTGSLKRYDSLDRLLNMIEKTNEVRFEIGDKTIKVESKE